MARFLSKRAKKPGLPPGTPVHTGGAKTEAVRITLIDYDETQFLQREVDRVEDCFPFRDRSSITWINVDGVHDVETVKRIGEHFGLHPLVIEDIVHTDQRPKLEDFEGYLYIVLKMLYYRDSGREEIVGEQISLVLSSNCVLSFQENPGDIFDPIRERIRSGRGRIRKMAADYLTYALIDAIVDHYFVILETYGERIEDKEEEVILASSPDTLQDIHRIKRDMVYIRKSTWPLREVISRLERAESELIQQGTRVYLRDVYDHTVQVIDVVETFRDLLSGLLDIYLSIISNRMNEIMKTLTIFAAIFIPLTFLVGVYGMNFEYIPELKWHWGYPALWCVMVVITAGSLFFFRKKKWL